MVLTVSKRAIIRTVCPCCRQIGELVDITGFSKSRIKKDLHELIEQGYVVERERPPGQGGWPLYELSKAAQESANKIDDEERALKFTIEELKFIERMMDNLSEDNSKGLAQQLSILDKYKDKSDDVINKLIKTASEAHDVLRTISAKASKQQKEMMKERGYR